MEQFNLEEWLQDKNRKVVTEHNKEVRIICTDINCAYPIIAAIKINDGRETPLSYDINGKCPFYEGNDLFFADEEEELTEFEKAMIQFSHERNSLIQFNHTTKEVNAHLYLYYEKLLDLAKNELKKEFKNEEYFRLITEHYKQGKQDALKSVPKYKKAKKDEVLDWVVKLTEDDNIIFSDVVYEGEYFIMLQSLKTLPFVEPFVAIDLNGKYHYCFRLLNSICKDILEPKDLAKINFKDTYEQAVDVAIKYTLENFI